MLQINKEDVVLFAGDEFIHSFDKIISKLSSVKVIEMPHWSIQRTEVFSWAGREHARDQLVTLGPNVLIFSIGTHDAVWGYNSKMFNNDLTFVVKDILAKSYKYTSPDKKPLTNEHILLVTPWKDDKSSDKQQAFLDDIAVQTVDVANRLEIAVLDLRSVRTPDGDTVDGKIPNDQGKTYICNRLSQHISISL